MGSPKVMETVIEIAGRLDNSLLKSFEKIAEAAEKIQAQSAKTAPAIDKLSATIRDQGDELEKAKREYASYVLAGEKSSKAAKQLAKHIKSLSSDLNDNEDKMREAMGAADKLTPSLGQLEDAAQDAKEGFTVMKGAAANLVAGGIEKIISTCSDAIRGLAGLSESTREYREDIGKLNSAWEAAGNSPTMATIAYKGFYSVLGEEDRSVEAVNHLAKFIDTYAELTDWTNIATGVWATFGDSLPIEGLTEAANETVKTGQVVGVLADALNWAGVSEDVFNKKLEGMKSEAKRVAFVTDTLNGLYSEAADRYRENNGSIMEARLANSNYADSLAEIGERMEPVTTEVTNGFNQIVQKVLQLTEGVDFAALSSQIGQAFDKFTNDIMPKIVEALGWIRDNKDAIIAGIVSIGTAFAAWKVIGTVMTAVGAFKSFTAAISAGQGVMAALNIVMGANPIVLIAAAIAGLVAGFIYLWNTCEGFRNFWIGLWETMKTGFSAAMEFMGNLINIIGEKMGAVGEFVADTVGGIFIGAINGLIGLVEAWLNRIPKAVNAAIGLINMLPGVSIEPLPLFELPRLPEYATGGFTSGPSIAGEAGTEAVISFDPAYRQQNLAYWAQAGRMLGASDGSLLSSAMGGTTSIADLGGVTFAPVINVTGKGGKIDEEEVLRAIRKTFPDFCDMLEEWLEDKAARCFA